jgi:hypothetical protein
MLTADISTNVAPRNALGTAHWPGGLVYEAGRNAPLSDDERDAEAVALLGRLDPWHRRELLPDGAMAEQSLMA